MKLVTVEIEGIDIEEYIGQVYNLELVSRDPSTSDDLYWVEGELGLVTHNCFPKDIQALIYTANKIGVNSEIIQAAWNKNLRLRPDKDWEQLKGRAVV